LTDLGTDRDALEVLVDSGKPFQISGFHGHGNEISACNRPYGGGIRSFPPALNASDVAAGASQMRGDDVNSYDEETSK
jgi:hypothetical protein